MIDTPHDVSPRPDRAGRRGRRITWAAAAAGCLVVAGLVVLHWATVRDHVEGWWFVSTRKTEIVTPESDDGMLWEPFSILAASTGRPVIIDPRAWGASRLEAPVDQMQIQYEADQAPPADPCARLRRLSGEAVLDALRQDRYRILEQRFPRAAYVVVEY